MFSNRSHKLAVKVAALCLIVTCSGCSFLRATTSSGTLADTVSTNPPSPNPTPVISTAAWMATWGPGTGPGATNPVTSSGPIATTSPTGAILLNPGDDVAAITKNAPPASTFYFNAGTYRMQSITVRTGDTYIGALGAILNGSRLLTSFKTSGSYWMVTGQTQKNELNGECEAAYPRCMYSEDLFVDDVPYTQTASLADLAPGMKRWFFDYDAQIIYLADDPTGHVVETSVSRVAFSGSKSTHVTIKNFVIEKYAIPLQMGAIGDQYPGSSWTVQNNEVLLNHGVGVRIGANSIATGNHVHHNGEMGMGGSGINLLVQGNEIDHNNYYSGVSCDWECGGTKFSNTQLLMVRSNYSHDNYGDGFWTDVNNIYTSYDGNWIVNNAASGIHHEISYDVLIQNNFVSGNGGTNTAWLWASQIMIVNSQNGEVRNNGVVVADWTASNEGNAIGILYQDRSSDPELFGSHNHVVGNMIHDNDVTFQGTISSNKGRVGVVSDLAGYDSLYPVADQSGELSVSNPSVYDPAENRYFSNHYHVSASSLTGSYFKNRGTSQSLEGDQLVGQEIGSTIDAN